MKSLLKNKLLIFIILIGVFILGLSKLKPTNSKVSNGQTSHSLIMDLSSPSFEAIPNTDNIPFYEIITTDDTQTTIKYNLDLSTTDKNIKGFNLKLFNDFKEIPFTINSQEYTEYKVNSTFNESINITIDNKYLNNSKLLISSLIADVEDKSTIKSPVNTIRINSINPNPNFKFEPTLAKEHYNYNNNFGLKLTNKSIDEFKLINDDAKMSYTLNNSNINIFIPKGLPHEKSVLIAAYIDDKLVKINDRDYLYYEFDNTDKDCIVDSLQIDENDLKNGDYLSIVTINDPLNIERPSMCDVYGYYKLEIN